MTSPRMIAAMICHSIDMGTEFYFTTKIFVKPRLARPRISQIYETISNVMGVPVLVQLFEVLSASPLLDRSRFNSGDTPILRSNGRFGHRATIACRRRSGAQERTALGFGRLSAEARKGVRRR